MGKKADLLLKQLVEKDEEIRRLKGMLNGGVSVCLDVEIYLHGRREGKAKLAIRTAWQGFGLEVNGGEEWIVNPIDLFTLRLGDVPSYLQAQADVEEE